MYIVRPIEEKDLPSFVELISESRGLSSLPHDEEILKKKLQLSLAAFHQARTPSPIHNYLFVLEEVATKRIGGCCGINSQVDPLEKYHYYLGTASFPPLFSNEAIHAKILVPTLYATPSSLICALYITEKWRHRHLGKLLSFARFLFISLFPARFEKQLLSEIRGVLTPEGESVFWNLTSKHFFKASYEELINFLNRHPHQIKELIPKYPIYIDLLPKEVQEIIGRADACSEPALNMLKRQGFFFSGSIDPFDGGPWIAAPTEEVEVIKEKKQCIIRQIVESDSSERKTLITNSKKEFRACLGSLSVDENTGEGTISRDIAQSLQVDIGETIAFSPL